MIFIVIYMLHYSLSMKRRYIALLSTITVLGQSMPAMSVGDVGRALIERGCLSCKVDYEVLLPGSEIPVKYDLMIASSAAQGDSLAPARYLIDWTLHTPTGNSTSGFSSYSDGDHFRFREGKMQEYHSKDDATPFAPAGAVRNGVGWKVQFADILPQALGYAFVEMAADSSYIYNVRESEKYIEISGVERSRGFDAREYTYRIDKSTYLPIEIEYTMNPGQPSEQLVTVRYGEWLGGDCPQLSESQLMERYPDAFAKYRQDSYAFENLPGERMPGWAVATLDGVRSTRQAGDGFQRPTVIAILDSSVDACATVVSELREAELSSPVAFDLVLAYVNNDRRSIEESLGDKASGEALVLVSASSLARDCGATDSPSFIICDASGKVSDVMIGRNNQLVSDVIQKVAIANTKY